MKILKTSILAASASIALLCAESYASAEVVVIASKSAPVSSLSVEQAKSIFLKKVEALPDGSSVIAVDLPADNAVRDEFYEKATNKNANQVKAYWAKRIFTGKGTPNDIQNSESSVKKWVASGGNHIGYVSPDAVDGSVKVLLRLP
jgi:ABC-type phosphate transport system substrate-binding protein